MTETTEPDRDSGRQRFLLAAAVVVAIVAVIVLAAVLWSDDDDVATDDATTPAVADDTTTTELQTTSTEATTTTAGETTTTIVREENLAVFPFVSDETRFDDPLDAAENWAEGVVGFVDPVYSEFREGDSRSGEVEVRPSDDGPTTTILLRQYDGTWWVLGSVAEAVEVDQPSFKDATSPLEVTGEAAAPTGTLEIELWTDAADEPLAMTSADVGQAQTPFEVTLTWDRQPETRTGALYLRSRDNGDVVSATVLRVEFAQD